MHDGQIGAGLQSRFASTVANRLMTLNIAGYAFVPARRSSRRDADHCASVGDNDCLWEVACASRPFSMIRDVLGLFLDWRRRLDLSFVVSGVRTGRVPHTDSTPPFHFAAPIRFKRSWHNSSVLLEALLLYAAFWTEAWRFGQTGGLTRLKGVKRV